MYGCVGELARTEHSADRLIDVVTRFAQAPQDNVGSQTTCLACGFLTNYRVREIGVASLITVSKPGMVSMPPAGEKTVLAVPTEGKPNVCYGFISLVKGYQY